MPGRSVAAGSRSQESTLLVLPLQTSLCSSQWTLLSLPRPGRCRTPSLAIQPSARPCWASCALGLSLQHSAGPSGDLGPRVFFPVVQPLLEPSGPLSPQLDGAVLDEGPWQGHIRVPAPRA